jgi:hypothetical protein
MLLQQARHLLCCCGKLDTGRSNIVGELKLRQTSEGTRRSQASLKVLIWQPYHKSRQWKTDKLIILVSQAEYLLKILIREATKWLL